MGILIDTSIFIAVERGKLPPEIFENKAGDTLFYLSVITTSELWHGFHRADTEARATKRLAYIKRINERMPALDIDEVVARENARLRAGLESQGKMIGINDSWIAATALAYGLKVVTRNEGEFNRVPGLVVEVW